MEGMLAIRNGNQGLTTKEDEQNFTENKDGSLSLNNLQDYSSQDMFNSYEEEQYNNTHLTEEHLQKKIDALYEGNNSTGDNIMNTNYTNLEGTANSETHQTQYSSEPLYNEAAPHAISYQNINPNISNSQSNNIQDGHNTQYQPQVAPQHTQESHHGHTEVRSTQPSTHASEVHHAQQYPAPPHTKKTPHVYQSNQVFPPHHHANNTEHTSSYAQPTYHQEPEQVKLKEQKNTIMSKLMSSNEKFMIIALLASIILTSIIIGVGTSLFSPQKETQDIQTEITLPPSSKLNLEQATEKISEPSTTNDDLVIVYGANDSTNTPKEESKIKDTSPSTSQAVNIEPQKITKNKPIAATNQPLSTNNISNPKTKPIPSTSAVISKTQYWIQVFSTTNKDKALQIKADLTNLGIAPTITTKTINQTIYYRLRIGPYYNKAESNKFLTWIKGNAKYKDSYISVSKTR